MNYGVCGKPCRQLSKQWNGGGALLNLEVRPLLSTVGMQPLHHMSDAGEADSILLYNLPPSAEHLWRLLALFNDFIVVVEPVFQVEVPNRVCW